MKYSLTFLLIGCLLNPAWSAEESGMAVDDFITILEKSEPWTYEKIEAKLGIKFAYTSSTGVVTRFTAHEALPLVKGLILQHISFTKSVNTNKTLYLNVMLDEKSSCFSLEQTKKLYPDGEVDFSNVRPGGGMLYSKKRAWGELVFGFRDSKAWNCLTSIGIITNNSLK